MNGLVTGVIMLLKEGSIVGVGGNSGSGLPLQAMGFFMNQLGIKDYWIAGKLNLTGEIYVA